MQQSLLVLVCELIFSNQAFASFSQKCNRDDYKLNDCLLNSVQTIWPTLVEGNEEYDFPSFNPFYIPHGIININNEFIEILNNTNMSRYDNLDFKYARVNFDNNTLELKFLQPLITFNANYEIQGKLLEEPIFGTGICNITYNDSLQIFGFNFNTTQKNNKEYINIISPYLEFESVKHIEFNFTNLFNGNEKKGRKVNDDLNKGWTEVLKFAKKEIELFLATFYSEAAQKLFNHVPIEDIFN